MSSTHLENVRLFINGEWLDSKTVRFGLVYNPSTGEPIAKAPLCGPDEADAAVQAAHGAFAAWRDTPVVERARVMFRLVALLEKHAEDIALRPPTLEPGAHRPDRGSHSTYLAETLHRTPSRPAWTPV